MTACIVDDDQIYVYGFKKLIALKNINLELIDFKNATEAFDFISDSSNAGALPDVIFLDINMPGMDGWEFMDNYKKVKSQLPKPIAIYMVSSSINNHDINRAKSIPEVTDYIVKPISAELLVNLLGSEPVH